MRLGGWTRIGIVLTGLWFIGALSVAFIDFQKMNAEQKTNLAIQPRPPKGYSIEPVVQTHFFNWSDPNQLHDDEFVRHIEFNISSSVLVFLGIPIACWALILSFIFCFHWIKNGFSRPAA